VNSSTVKYDPVAGVFEHGNKPLGPIKVEIFLN
jgi:hypothetical protein